MAEGSRQRQRDYRAEYRRRLEFEKERAEAEGREFSRARARGHKDNAYENLRRSVRRYERQTRYGISADEYRVIVNQSIDLVGLERTRELLLRKREATVEFLGRVDQGMAYSAAAEGSLGRENFNAYKKREAFLPIELFWYHGNR